MQQPCFGYFFLVSGSSQWLWPVSYTHLDVYKRQQGAQPLVSRCYGQNDHAGARKLLLLGSGTVLVLAAVLYAAVSVSYTHLDVYKRQA